jgi:hypothetical protein
MEGRSQLLASSLLRVLRDEHTYVQVRTVSNCAVPVSSQQLINARQAAHPELHNRDWSREGGHQRVGVPDSVVVNTLSTCPGSYSSHDTQHMLATAAAGCAAACNKN